MKKTIVSILFVMLLVSCTNYYRYSVVEPERSRLAFTQFNLERVDVRNAELLMLDRSAVSNTLHNVTVMAMKKNGYTAVSNAPVQMSVSVLVEGNDVLNNQQSVTMLVDFRDASGTLANFLISAKDRALILDKELLVNELGTVIQQLRAGK